MVSVSAVARHRLFGAFSFSTLLASAATVALGLQPVPAAARGFFDRFESDPPRSELERRQLRRRALSRGRHVDRAQARYRRARTTTPRTIQPIMQSSPAVAREATIRAKTTLR